MQQVVSKGTATQKEKNMLDVGNPQKVTQYAADSSATLENIHANVDRRCKQLGYLYCLHFPWSCFLTSKQTALLRRAEQQKEVQE